MNKTKTVGILGGMGPYATLSFTRMLLDLTPAKKDWDHLRIITDMNPHIPSRSRHLLFDEASPIPGMIESCRKLANYPVDFIVVPCNSASYFLPEVREAVSVPILDIREVTVQALARKLPHARRVAALSAVVPYAKRIYQPYLEARGLEFVSHAEELQRESEAVIEAIKLNEPQAVVARRFERLLGSIRERHGVDAVILGCTEFGCLGELQAPVPLIDSSRELAQGTVKFAFSETNG